MLRLEASIGMIFGAVSSFDRGLRGLGWWKNASGHKTPSISRRYARLGEEGLHDVVALSERTFDGPNYEHKV
jgi:hypothetical protein